MKQLVAILFVSLCVVSVAAGQCPTTALTTTFASNNGQSGNMFDLVAINDVTVCSFDVNLDPGTWDMEIYILPAGMPYLPNVNNAVPWGAPIASLTGVVSAGTNIPTLLPVSLNVNIPAGGTQAFYVTVTNGTAINYTNGTATGALFAADANLQYYEGSGLAYPFNANFNPRIWNGNINYCTGLNAGCPAAPLPPFQVNQNESSADLDGVQSNGVQAAITPVCVGGTSVLTYGSTLIGFLSDAAIDFGPAIASALPLTTQTVNLNPLSPTLLWRNTLGPAFSLQAHPGTITIPVPATVAVTAVTQQVVVDATNPDGAWLSQAAQLEISAAAGAPVAGPTGDDSFLQIALTAPPLCGSPISFYGTSYSELYVISNGRAMFTGSDTDFSPTVAEAMTDNPFVGAWFDMNPAAGGTITTTAAGGLVTVAYAGVPTFGGTNANSFNIIFDNNTGNVVLDSLTGINAANTGNAFLGMSGGNAVGATDPGAVSYAPPGAGVTTNATDMIYNFGIATPAGVAGGANVITFTPNGIPNYDWTSN